jgi:hypothetical protein
MVMTSQAAQPINRGSIPSRGRENYPGLSFHSVRTSGRFPGDNAAGW